VQGVRDWYNAVNPATLSGALDVVVVRHADGTFSSSPFHVRFGKFAAFQQQEKTVCVCVCVMGCVSVCVCMCLCVCVCLCVCACPAAAAASAPDAPDLS
jgi:hypothetical protein